MGLKESLKKLQEDQERDRKLSLKHEVEKELSSLKNDKIIVKKCIMCSNDAKYSIKGSSDCYCKNCAIECFGDLKSLKRFSEKKKILGKDMHEVKYGKTAQFITGNIKKYLELEKIIPNLKQVNLDLIEIQELDAKKIIEHKLLEAKRKFIQEKKIKDAVFIVEDTSLYLDCMKGLPGPLIKWFLQTIGNEGLYNIAKNSKNYKAEARTLIGFYDSGKIKYFQGIVKGRIVKPRKSDFGWDALFKPEGHTKVMGEMTKDEKNSISMRGKAAGKLKEYLEKK
jgi:inosine triphosphate pyrophosphatase